MANIYSIDGMVVAILLMICTCAFIRRVPRLKAFFLSEKKGAFGTLYKASIIGVRLHWLVALLCIVTGVYLVFFR
eukprot:m.38801 g.38801  ORF g.38801 m.38801 type:complete len:75 (+) comp11696_c0_seq4:146-370(+)